MDSYFSGTGKEAGTINKKNGKRKRAPKNSCPFEDPQKNSGKKPVLIYGNNRKWEIQVIENKYPAFMPRKVCPVVFKNGPYQAIDAVGYHELVITKIMTLILPASPKNSARQVFEIFRDRYLMFLNDKCLHYVSIFHNWGPTAGASIYHPHYQIIAIPVIPPDVSHSLDGSLRYYKKIQEMRALRNDGL